MCACAQVLLEAGGPRPAQATPMTPTSATREHRQADLREDENINPAPDFLIGKASKSAHRPAFGRPEGGF